MGSSTNGKAGKSPAMLLDDPMARVLDAPRVPTEVTIAGAIVLHLVIGAGAVGAGLYEDIASWQRGIRDVIAYQLQQYEVDVVKEPEKPPEPEPEKEPEPEPEPEPEKAPPPKEAPPEAPPQPAEAANVLTSDPNPNEPVDLTGGFVTGSGNTYAGGSTSSQGTSKTAVYNPAAANTGVPGGTGTAPAPPPPRKDDKSRGAGLLGSSDWNDCPFPGEADAEQIDSMKVLIKVDVKPDGSPSNVTVVEDPGHGFGREARKCAMRKKYSPGLDADGNPIASTTKPFRVRFER
ncbi:MAG: energy transducer TonB [Labilithrix sp.]|nr:energy transducer TonB [Labilithrix sp.]MCW5812321.1 energy transducer TonB [Labilithrix sp.]